MLYKEVVTQSAKKEVATFETFEVINQEIYAQILDKNILVKFSPKEAKMKIIDFYNEYRFKHCIYQENAWYCVDNLGEVLVVYDIRTNESKVYCLDAHVKDDNNIAMLDSYDNYIVIVSQYKGIIYILDTINEKMDRYDVLNREIERRYEEQKEYIIRGWIIDTYIYLIVDINKNYYICRYDLKRNLIEELSANVSFSEVRGVYNYEHKLYILQNDFTIGIWDIKDNTVNMLVLAGLKQMVEKMELKYKYAFSTLAVTERNIWFFPAGGNEDIYIYNILEKNAYIYDNYPSDFFYFNEKGWSKYSEIKERDGFIYVAARLSNYYLIINKETGLETWKSVCTADFREHYDYIISKKYIKDGETQIIYESPNVPLRAFLIYQQKELINKRKLDKVGEKIWEMMR